MSKERELAILSQRVRALSQTGLTYVNNDYDRERYEELLSISDSIVSVCSGIDEEEVLDCFCPRKEYVTPKVDIRAIVFNESDELLMVQEKLDGLWSVPGGWADVGYTPKEVAIKEVKEETGLDVEALRLLAVVDMSKHNHPLIPFYVYKIFILCRLKGGAFTEAFDILDKGFFPLNTLPPLSLERIIPEEIEMVYELYKDPSKQVYID